MNLFAVIENLFTKKEVVDSSTAFKESYMVNRYLSMLPETFLLSVESNRLSTKLPGWATGSLLFNSIDKRVPAPWIKYIKKPRQLVDKEVLLRLGEYLCCSYKHAIDSKKILEANGVNVYGMFGMKKGGKK